MGAAYENDGAIWLRTGEHGDEDWVPALPAP
jgi:hypothetical protein